MSSVKLPEHRRLAHSSLKKTKSRIAPGLLYSPPSFELGGAALTIEIFVVFFFVLSNALFLAGLAGLTGLIALVLLAGLVSGLLSTLLAVFLHIVCHE